MPGRRMSARGIRLPGAEGPALAAVKGPRRRQGRADAATSWQATVAPAPSPPWSWQSSRWPGWSPSWG